MKLKEKKERELNFKGKIVAIGGGTGLPTVLRSFKDWATDITAIVTMADDGGSSGRLRRELGIPPPGDIRNCLVALSNAPYHYSALFQYRFKEESSLAEHSLGNLIIAALTDITGDFVQAIEIISELLEVQGNVYPSTLEDITLVGAVKGGKLISGQARVARTEKLEFVRLEPPDVEPYPPALQAIREADLIIIGPGSLFTSLIPNLLVKGIAEAILEAEARKIYVCNTLNQRRETYGFTVTDYLETLYQHSSRDLIDLVVVADLSPYKDKLKTYSKKGIFPVSCGSDELEDLDVEVIVADIALADNLLHHDWQKLSSLWQEIVATSRLLSEKFRMGSPERGGGRKEW